MKWMPHNSPPEFSGWYYVRETQPRLVIGIRYFSDADNSWHCVSHRQLVPNNNFHDWLNIPNITNRQFP